MENRGIYCGGDRLGLGTLLSRSYPRGIQYYQDKEFGMAISSHPIIRIGIGLHVQLVGSIFTVSS